MNCREKIEAVFKGKLVDKVPFALKEWRIPQCEMEKTSWRVEKIFKTPDDYDAIEFMIRDKEYLPDYEPFIKAQKQIGGDAFFKTGAPGLPLHDIMYGIMGIETFSIEGTERRERIKALCELIAENNRKIYSIVAKSPAMIVQCGGNYTPEVLGKERFIEYVLPHWEEATEILHQGNKLVGYHLDANNKLWAKEIGDSKLDWIEAFTPTPDTDMTVAEARKMWSGKMLFINFPSSVHLQKPDVIAETTKQILKESAPGDRFIIGITENVPEDRWRESFSVILRTINKFGKLPIQ